MNKTIQYDIFVFTPVVFFYRIKCDYVKFTGGDRLDLLNRLSTNDLKALPIYHGKKTILTSDKGRIIDLLTLYSFEGFLFAACSFKNSETVVKHLDKYIIMEDFKILDMTGTHESILFFGKESPRMCKDLFGVDVDFFSENDFAIRLIEGAHTIVAKNDDSLGGFILVYAVKSEDIIQKKVLGSEKFKDFNPKELDDDEYEALRIEKGIPKFGNEMGEHSNPLECNLTKYVSFTKGCYIGQEVIARLDTYDKVSKHLIGIKAEEKIGGSAPLNEMRILTGNNECGIVTSKAESKKYEHIGLGFVKTAFLNYEKEYQIKCGSKAIPCRIVPFN